MRILLRSILPIPALTIMLVTMASFDGLSTAWATAPVNGVCGGASGTAVSSRPTPACQSGTPTSTATGNGPWFWVCIGSNGGTTVPCEATVASAAPPVNGVCGGASGTSVSSAPTPACQSGTPTSAVTGNGPWFWVCIGSNGGTTVPCEATKAATPINGVCGGASGTSVSSAPTPACQSGTPTSAVTGSGPWFWVCIGSNGGTTVPCEAMSNKTQVNGVCGGASGTSVSSAPTPACQSGTPTSAVTGSGPWFWVCIGSNGGTTVPCEATKTVTPINGVCGGASGTSVSSAPTPACQSGTPTSAVTGAGPWFWVCIGSNGGTTVPCEATTNQCIGSVIQSPASIILPPSVPQPATANDIVGINIQNTGTTATNGQLVSFAQIFRIDQVQSTDRLVARVNGNAYQVQMDTLATWPDGSVKLAKITAAVPDICAGSQIQVLLSKATSSDPVFSTTPVSLTAALFNLDVTLAFTSGSYSGTQQVNLGTALKVALANNPSYWLLGPLATQSRVDVPLAGGPMHLTADVTAYRDGTLSADVQFNNDLATVLPQNGANNPLAALPPTQFTTTINFQGTASSYTVSQDQYTDWHAVLWSNGAPSINVQHDVSYLEHTGAILPYDRTTGVSNTTVAGYASLINGAPLAINGVTTYMGQTGGARISAIPPSTIPYGC